MAEAGIIDLGALRRLLRAMDGDMNDMRDLLESFISDTPPLFGAMRLASAAGDWAAFKRAAHTAKGAARDFGAMGMANICAGFESEASGGVVPDVAERLTILEGEFAASVREVERLLNSDVLT